MTTTTAKAAVQSTDIFSEKSIPFIDLQAQRRRLGTRIEDAISRVLDHGQFIMGPEVAELEANLAAFCGAKHAIGCSSGTDALLLGLLALGVKPGDGVFVPSFTFAATAEVVALIGATPIFVDVLPDTFNMDPASLESAVGMIERGGTVRPVGIIPVDLFGQPADYPAIEAIAARHDLWVMADAAQSFGASLCGRNVGTLALVTTTSFFPAKPLGCYGDGGAIFTNDDALAAMVRSMIVHGKGTEKYDNVRIGINGRLDTLQAAILLEKLNIFGEEIAKREQVAHQYGAALKSVVTVPALAAQRTSVWAQYTVVIENRDAVALTLRSKGVPSAIYYPRPLHRQTAFDHFPIAPSGLPVSERLSTQVLSLPIHAYLDEASQNHVANALSAALAS